MTPKFQPSKYQQAIYDFIKTGSGNAVVDAVAGSGKSTTIVNALKEIPSDQTVLFLAFNKAIVEELKIKVGVLPNVEIKTLHSLGASAIMKNFRCQINADKYKAFINENIANRFIRPTCELDYEEAKEYKANIMKLVDLIRVNLCASVESIEEVAFKHGLDLYDNEISIARKVVKWGIQNEETMDFTDMIFMPNVKKIKMTQYDWVFIDECQDLNASQRELFLKCVKPETGRFVAVGDPRQAIYGFAGADIKSFQLLKDTANTIQLPLSVCYRCDSNIIDLAKTIVPQIEARDGADKGIVQMDDSIYNVQDGDMILCRTSAPLAKLCMQYISNGVKAYIKGKDIGTNLINMLNKTRRTNIEDAMQVFGKELAKIENRVAKQQKCSMAEARTSSQYTTYEDKVAAINVLSEGLTQVRQLISRIEQIFSEGNKQGICLSTIHKSKGLETNRVFILMPDEIRNRRSMKIAWMAEQEDNLVYVAFTRAKHHLGFIQDFSM